jgi:MoaA/NifB/PqqE/SkfB family radical SAM enzyme
LISSSHATIEYARKYFKDSKRMDIPCYLGYLKIYVGSHGEVYSGCWALPPLGNLRENTLKEIITSKKYKKRLYEMFLKKCPGCSCNYQTNLLYHFPSLCNEIKGYIRKR